MADVPIVLTPEARVAALSAALLQFDGGEPTEENVAVARAEALRFVLAVTVLATLEQEAAMANARPMPPMTPRRRRSKRMEH